MWFTRSMPEVRAATAEDLPAVGRALARAFTDDPVFRHLVPSDDRWGRHAARYFQADTANRLRLGATYTTASVQGAALWAPPGRWRPTVASVAREAPAALRLFGPRTVRGLRVLAQVEKAHPREPEHWYLAVLGTDPDQQGKGVGSALLAPVLDRCDAEGVPAYLESSKEANIAFYARHGFDLRDPIVIPDGPTIHPMWREPRG